MTVTIMILAGLIMLANKQAFIHWRAANRLNFTFILARPIQFHREIKLKRRIHGDVIRR